MLSMDGNQRHFQIWLTIEDELLQGREYTPPWFVQQEGQWFSKAVHILSRRTKLFMLAH
jgi:hypothetical protein